MVIRLKVVYFVSKDGIIDGILTPTCINNAKMLQDRLICKQNQFVGRDILLVRIPETMLNVITISVILGFARPEIMFMLEGPC